MPTLGRRRTLILASIAVLAVTVGAGLAGPGSARAATSSLDPATASRIDRFVEQQMGARRVPGVAIAVVQDGKLVHQRGFGTAGSAGRRVTVTTPFVLGSVTKSFTALAVMQLVDAGAVSLDTPIARYLPQLSLADGAEARITVRQLLNQTSGIPALAGGKLLRSAGDGTLEDAVRELTGTGLSAPPGTRYEYANANYVLLGRVIEQVSGKPYGTYVERHIFAPLGMRSSFASPKAAAAAGLAAGHRYWFGFSIAHGPTSPQAARPAGYLMSSAADMGRYLAMYLNGGELDGRRIISRRALETMVTPMGNGRLGPWAGGIASRYAMGWFVGGPWQEPALLHPGRAPDSSAMVVLLPHRRDAIVVLMNAGHELPLPGAAGELQRIPRGVVSLLLGEEPAPGTSLARFYIVFDIVLVVVLTAIAWALVRLLRHRQRSLGNRRRLAGMARGVGELAAAALLLGMPALSGQTYAGAWLWWPDLALALLAIAGLLGATGITRILVRWRAPSIATVAADGASPARTSTGPTVGGASA